MKKIVIIGLFIFSIHSNAQSPWTQKKGKFYTQLSFTTIPSYNTIYGNPDYVIPRKVSDNTIQMYGEYGVSDKSIYRWRSKYAGMDVAELRRLKELEEENRRLKKLVADQALDIQLLKEINGKKW